MVGNYVLTMTILEGAHTCGNALVASEWCRDALERPRVATLETEKKTLSDRHIKTQA